MFILTTQETQVQYGITAALNNQDQNPHNGIHNSQPPAQHSKTSPIPTFECHSWSHAMGDLCNRTTSPDPQQECPSCSPSIQPGEKHQRSDDSDCETEEVVHKAQKINERSGWLKAHDYDDVGKEVILQAATIYHCLLSTENGFPELVAETELVKLAWEDANKESGVPPLALTPDIAKIVSYWFCFNHVYCLNHSYLSDQGPWITNLWWSQGENKIICWNYVWFQEWP